MPKSIYVGYLAEQSNSNPHFLNRLVKLLNHFISIEPPKKPKGYESHHIVPRSWKPEWEKVKDNLLKVPAKAHYVIHHLMWKAFPKNSAMALSFYTMHNTRQAQKITAKVFEILKLKSGENRRQNALDRVANNTHPWLGGEIGRKTQRRRVTNGTHNFLGGEIARKTALKRLIDGTHHLLGPDHNRKRISNGTHPAQNKKTCPHCGKTCGLGQYGRWHRKQM